MRFIDRFSGGDPHRFRFLGESEAEWFDRSVLSHTPLRDPFDKRADVTVTAPCGVYARAIRLCISRIQTAVRHVTDCRFAGKLDWVLLSPGLRCVRQAVVPGRGRSDHDMLYVEVVGV